MKRTGLSCEHPFLYTGQGEDILSQILSTATTRLVKKQNKKQFPKRCPSNQCCRKLSEVLRVGKLIFFFLKQIVVTLLVVRMNNDISINRNLNGFYGNRITLHYILSRTSRFHHQQETLLLQYLATPKDRSCCVSILNVRK